MASKRNLSLLAPLGIYGSDAYEDMLLAGVVTGDPVLLVGNPGSAKTILVERFAQALGYNEEQIGCYSAPTLNYDDLIGIPVPIEVSRENADIQASLDIFPGDTVINMRYGLTPDTVWPKKVILFDELNRSRPDMQNSLLSIIRERKCLGRHVDLHYIFACQNELKEKGTMPLDAALADRFAWIIHVPDIDDLSSEDQLAVLCNSTSQDAYMIKRDSADLRSPELDRLIDEARKMFKKMDGGNDFGIPMFVRKILKTLNSSTSNEARKISGRRGSALVRNIKALYCVLKAKYGEDRIDIRENALLARAIMFSLNDSVLTQSPRSYDVILAAVTDAIDQIIDTSTPIGQYIKEIDVNPIEGFIHALENSEIYNSKANLSELVEQAFNAGQHFDSENDLIKSGVFDSVGATTASISVWAMCHGDMIDKNTYGRVVDSFGKIKELTSSLGYDADDRKLDSDIIWNIVEDFSDLSQIHSDKGFTHIKNNTNKVSAHIFIESILRRMIGSTNKDDKIGERIILTIVQNLRKMRDAQLGHK